MKKIVLIGYMSSGKSTIAKLLSEKLQMRSCDLDKLIEKEVGLSIENIFQQKGEVFFRKKEHEIFKIILSSDDALIVSTGGGTPCYANNHLLLNENEVVSVYLKASIDTLYERLLHEKEHRPLVAHKTREELKEFIAMHLFERSYYYNQATYTITTDNKTPEKITEELIGVLA
jgi:shikimate kinase